MVRVFIRDFIKSQPAPGARIQFAHSIFIENEAFKLSEKPLETTETTN